MIEKSEWNVHTKEWTRKLAPRTERIVEKVRQYVLKETGYDLEDWLYYECGVNAEDDICCRYQEDGLEWWQIDPMEYFDEDDWRDVEDYIMNDADNYIDFVKEQRA